MEFIQKTISAISKADNKPLVLTLDVLKRVLRQKLVNQEEGIPVTSSLSDSNSAFVASIPAKAQESSLFLDKKEKTSPKPLEVSTFVNAAEIPADIVVLRDPTGLLLGEGKIKDVATYFKNKFERLRNLLLKRPDCKGGMTIEQAKTRKSSGENIKIIGMVLERKEMGGRGKEKKNGNNVNSISIELDDLESVITVIFPGKNGKLIKKAARIIPDQVICVEGFLTEENILIASEVYWPDIPFRKRGRNEIPPISAIFLSDLHFGSKYFLTDKFEAFLNWLNGETGSEEQIQLAKSVKYIIIAGDLIDGVGVYPNQDKNLAIIDLRAQYHEALRYLQWIPNHIKIIIIPGGPHDAVRKAYPQPALGKKYSEELFELNNVILLGNPAQFTIHGVNILVFHGDSLDDLIQVIPGLSYQKPAEIMKELVINRHLTPIYGSQTWIAPEVEDWMIIEEIPDILHCGHTHVSDFKEYRGVILLNSGTFQSETDYQKSLGIKPTPGKIPIVNLQSLKVKFLQF